MTRRLKAVVLLRRAAGSHSWKALCVKGKRQEAIERWLVLWLDLDLPVEE